MRNCWALLLLLLASPAWAWSAGGHARIAEGAMAQLSAHEQRYFNQRAQALLKNERAKKWRKRLVQYSPVAQSAVWPDTRRDQILTTLFTRFAKGPVPEALAPFASVNTQRWHYVNAQYWDPVNMQLLPAPSKHGRCEVKRNGQLDRAWAALMAAYTQVQTPAAQGLILAFISHLIADAYQPLHALASVGSDCKSDAGGNGYCLESAGARCKLNLHRLWDQGFSVFNSPVATLRADSAGVSFKGAVKLNVGLGQVLKVDKAEARFIYSVAQRQEPSSAYQQRAVRMVERQSREAAQTLAAVLRQLYALDQS